MIAVCHQLVVLLCIVAMRLEQTVRGGEKFYNSLFPALKPASIT